MKISEFLAGWLKSQNTNYFQTIAVPVPFVRAFSGNGNDAIMLSQILYWHLPGSSGQPRLKVKRDGDYWLAKTYSDWEKELGMGEVTARKSIGRLKSRGLIETKVMKFNGVPTIHLRILWDALEALIRSNESDLTDQMETIQEIRTDRSNGSDPYTETTKTDNTNRDKVGSDGPPFFFMESDRFAEQDEKPKNPGQDLERQSGQDSKPRRPKPKPRKASRKSLDSDSPVNSHLHQDQEALENDRDLETDLRSSSDQKIKSSAAPQKFSAAPVRNCAPVAPEPWLEAFNSLRSPEWSALHPENVSRAILRGFSAFVRHAGGDEALALYYFKVAIWYGAKDPFMACKDFRPPQLLDPESKMFVGHLIGEGLVAWESSQ